MHKTMWKYLILVLVIPGLLVTVSCGKKAVQSEPVMTTSADDEAAREAADAAKRAEMERQRRMMEEQRLREQEMAAAKTAAEKAKMEAMYRFMDDDVYYDFDSDTLSMDAQETLQEKAQWLMQNPDAQVIVEGHCDERGTNDYNLALGDRRAKSAINFLVALGISPSRLTPVSYGEERPEDLGHDEMAWSKNRRAHFVLK